MAVLKKKVEYLLQTRVDCTWESDVIGTIYPKFVLDYQLKVQCENDVIKIEDSIEEGLSVVGKDELPSNDDTFNYTEDMCLKSDISMSENSFGNKAAEPCPLSTQTCYFSDPHKSRESTDLQGTDDSTSEKKPASEYTCRVCDKKFLKQRYLTKHQKRHSNERPYKCAHCDKKFKVKRDLNRHVGTHPGDHPYSCDLCSYSCTDKSLLPLHLLTHTGEKSYFCNQCSFSCARKSDLTVHLRIHTGEKLYSCSQCNAKFHRRSNLKEHLRTHTGEKPYTCEHCGKVFAQRSSLNSHKRLHIGSKS